MIKLPSVRACEIVSRLNNDDGEVLFDMDKLSEILEAKSMSLTIMLI